MISHVAEASCPVCDGEVSVSPPAVSVSGRATPHPFADVVIQVDIDLLLRALGRNSIKDLQSRRTGTEVRVLGKDLAQYLGSVGGTKCFCQGSADGDVLAAVRVYLVDHLNGVGETDGVHSE